jgi:hypothetical protein
MEGLALTSAKAECMSAESFRQRIKTPAECPVDDQSTDAGSGPGSASSSSASSEVEIVRRETNLNEEGWHTPAGGAAECCDLGPNAIAAAVAAALEPPRPDWWDDANTKAVPGLEACPSLTRLLAVDFVKHPGVGKSRPVPWTEGESHGRYQKLGAREPDQSYLALWLNTGDVSLLSLHQVVDRQALERCFADDPLKSRLKLLIRPVKCVLPFPGKGPKEADTVGTFFGKGASLTRSLTAEGADIVVLQIDLYLIWFLRLALQNIGFRHGNVVDIIVVDWPGQAVVASSRVAVTDSFLALRD